LPKHITKTCDCCGHLETDKIKVGVYGHPELFRWIAALCNREFDQPLADNDVFMICSNCRKSIKNKKIVTEGSSLILNSVLKQRCCDNKTHEPLNWKYNLRDRIELLNSCYLEYIDGRPELLTCYFRTLKIHDDWSLLPYPRSKQTTYELLPGQGDTYAGECSVVRIGIPGAQEKKAKCEKRKLVNDYQIEVRMVGDDQRGRTVLVLKERIVPKMDNRNDIKNEYLSCQMKASKNEAIQLSSKLQQITKEKQEVETNAIESKQKYGKTVSALKTEHEEHHQQVNQTHCWHLLFLFYSCFFRLLVV
jgi:hypothetical protein